MTADRSLDGRLPPTPPASDERTRRAMRGNRRMDTEPEIAVRRLLHGAGFRFRKDYAIKAGDVRTRADVVFPRQRVAIFIDGCYWHGCPHHCRMPSRNANYWRAKIDRNRRRDARVDEALAAEGWTVIRCWEHDDAAAVAARVRATLSASPTSVRAQ